MNTVVIKGLRDLSEEQYNDVKNLCDNFTDNFTNIRRLKTFRQHVKKELGFVIRKNVAYDILWHNTNN